MTIRWEDGDREVLADGTVDFFTFSYYFTCCVTTHVDAESTEGNLVFGVAKVKAAR